jgi:uncharacterized membrane protein YeaQ/YmgE (transglycosylase-associated protein family)
VIGYGVASYAVYGLGYSWRAALVGLGVFVLVAGMSVFLLSAEEWAGTRSRRSSSKDSFYSMTSAMTRREDEGFCAQSGKLLSYPDFWLLCLPPCFFYLVGTAAEYWAVRLLTCTECWGARALTEEDASRGFLIGCTLGPLLGLVLGGPLFDFFGGYRSVVRARLLCMVIGFSATLLSPLMLYPPSPYLLLVAVSFNAMIIGLIIPALTGILLTSVPSRLRPMASGVFGTIVNIIGFQAGPSVVGIMSDFTGDIMVGWRCAIAPCIIGAPLLLMVSYLRACQKKGYSEEDDVDGDEGEDVEDGEGEELDDME